MAWVLRYRWRLSLLVICGTGFVLFKNQDLRNLAVKTLQAMLDVVENVFSKIFRCRIYFIEGFYLVQALVVKVPQDKIKFGSQILKIQDKPKFIYIRSLNKDLHAPII